VLESAFPQTPCCRPKEEPLERPLQRIKMSAAPQGVGSEGRRASLDGLLSRLMLIQRAIAISCLGGRASEAQGSSASLATCSYAPIRVGRVRSPAHSVPFPPSPISSSSLTACPITSSPGGPHLIAAKHNPKKRAAPALLASSSAQPGAKPDLNPGPELEVALHEGPTPDTPCLDPVTTRNAEAWQQGRLLRVGQQLFWVEVNPPMVARLEVPGGCFVGLQLCPLFAVRPGLEFSSTGEGCRRLLGKAYQWRGCSQSPAHL
jgi:hypothetical protein